MATYLLAYRGGRMPESDGERQKTMEAWGAWFGRLGSSVTDQGNPFGASKTVGQGGEVKDGGSGLSGYSVITADSLEAAVKAAQQCPVLLGGATVEVYEAVDVMAATGAPAS